MEEEFFGYYKWKEVANLYLDLKDKWPRRVYLIRYEDLVINAEKQVENLYQFAGLQFHTQTKEFLSQCNRTIVNTPYSVFKPKNVKNRWREDFPKTISDEIYADLSKTRLEQFLI